MEILEDFDFLGQERKVRSLMGKLMLTWYRTQRDAFKTWSDEDMARRRAEQREFDEDWFGPKRKQKRGPRTRKPVDKLTSADFNRYRIWEFATDEEGKAGQDETWVRPVASKSIPLNAYAQLVAAEFSTFRRKKLRGFMTVTTVKNTVEIEPGAIIKGKSYRPLPRSPRERQAFRRSLRLSEAALFPLRYELRARIHGKKSRRQGILH